MPIQNDAYHHHQYLPKNGHNRIKIRLELLDDLVHKELAHSSKDTEDQEVFAKSFMRKDEVYDWEEFAEKEADGEREEECQFVC